MSTLLSAKIRTQRVKAAGGETPSGDITPWVETVASLVPAEVLTIHALVISWATTTKDSVTTITNRGLLQVMFVVLIVVSMGLWYVGHIGEKMKNFDYARIVIPPLAFVTWTMLQPVSVFDAVWPMEFGWRMAAAVVAALILGVCAKLLAGSKP